MHVLLFHLFLYLFLLFLLFQNLCYLMQQSFLKIRNFQKLVIDFIKQIVVHLLLFHLFLFFLLFLFNLLLFLFQNSCYQMQKRFLSIIALQKLVIDFIQHLF
jgi:hypothetical protein